MSYNVNCVKCKANFISNDEADSDGEAFCEACKKANLEIAKKVDEQIAARRANRGPAINGNIYHEVLKKPKGSLTYMNLR